MPGRKGRRDARKKGRKGRRGCGSVFTFLICDRDMLFTHDRSLMLPSLWGEIPKAIWGRGSSENIVFFFRTNREPSSHVVCCKQGCIQRRQRPVQSGRRKWRESERTWRWSLGTPECG